MIGDDWVLERQSEGSEHWVIRAPGAHRHKGGKIMVGLAHVGPVYTGFVRGEGPRHSITPDEAAAAARLMVAAPKLRDVVRKFVSVMESYADREFDQKELAALMAARTVEKEIDG